MYLSKHVIETELSTVSGSIDPSHINEAGQAAVKTRFNNEPKSNSALQVNVNPSTAGKHKQYHEDSHTKELHL